MPWHCARHLGGWDGAALLCCTGCTGCQLAQHLRRNHVPQYTLPVLDAKCGSRPPPPVHQRSLPVTITARESCSVAWQAARWLATCWLRTGVHRARPGYHLGNNQYSRLAGTTLSCSRSSLSSWCPPALRQGLLPGPALDQQRAPARRPESSWPRGGRFP